MRPTTPRDDGSTVVTTRRRRWKRRLARVAATAGLALALPGVAHAAAGSRPPATVDAPTVTPAPPPHGATDVGTLDGATVLDLTVTLDSRDPAGLDQFVGGVTTPGSVSYRRYLVPGEFGARFGAEPATVARVTDELRAAGLHPGPPGADRLSIPVQATADEAGAAFGTRFVRTRLADGRVGHRHTTAAVVPAGAAGIVGLDDWPLTRRKALAPRTTAAATPGGCPAGGAVPGTWSAADLASAYGFPGVTGGNGGAGQTVALYELSDYADGDVTTFQDCQGARPSVTRVPVDGGTSDTTGAGEVMVDADVLMALAPKASILIYVAPNTASGALDAYRAIVNDDRAQIVTASWGRCEADVGPSAAGAENTLFKAAAAQGQTVFAAAGDTGSADCYGTDGTTGLAVDDPASQPYVTGVGGTTLASVAPRAETVWNARSAAGGGGVSQLWPLPAYQKAVRMATSSPCGATGGCRQVPDVAASADPAHGYTVYCSVVNACSSGGWLAAGGTSAAAPLWAAATSLLDAACGVGHRIGFANPALYAAAATLHDVTAGTNDALGINAGAYAAGAGFDLASGLGTPDLPALAASLCPGATPPPPPDPVASVTPAAGRYGTVTIGASAPPTPFTVANTGTGSLSVSAVTVTGADAADFPVTGDTCTGAAIPAGATCAVQVAFRPSDPRPEAASLTISSNPTTSPAAVPLAGTGAAAADPPVTTAAAASGYWMLTADGHVHPFGATAAYGDAAAALAPLLAGGVRAVKLEATPTGRGYWIVDSAGHVHAFGDAADVGGVPPGALRPGERVTSLSATPTGHGYWLFTDRGRVFAYGDAPFLGDMSATKLNGAILGSIATPSGRGYYLVGSDGGIFAFGDATFFGSMGATPLNAAVESLVPTADGRGYWLVARDGGIFAFGDATFHGSMGATRLNAPVTGMVRFGGGYLMVATDGGIFDFSDRPFLGSLAGSPLPQPVVAVASLNT